MFCYAHCWKYDLIIQADHQKNTKLEMWTYSDKKVYGRLCEYSHSSETTFLFAEGFIAFPLILIAPQND